MDLEKLSKSDLINHIKNLELKLGSENNSFKDVLGNYFSDKKILSKYSTDYNKSIAILDLKGNYLEKNNALIDLFKNKIGTSDIKSVFDIVESEHSDSLAKYFNKLDFNKSLKGILKIKDLNNKSLFFECISKKVKSDLSSELIISVVKDVTSDIISNAKLKQSSKSYQNIFDSTHELITISNRKGIILNVNKALANYYNKPISFFIGKSGEVFSESIFGDRTEIISRIKNVWETGKPTNFKQLCPSENGKVIPHDISIYRSEYFNEDVVISVSRVKKEEYEYKKALEESETKYSSIINTMNEGILIVDENDYIQFANNKIFELTGYNHDDLIGKKGHDVLIREDERYKIVKINKERKKGISSTYEVKMLKKDGTSFWVKISGTPYQTEKFKGSIGVVTDISENKELKDNQTETLKNINEIIYRLKIDEDPINTEVVYVSNKMADVIGFKPEDFIKNPKIWIENVHPDDLKTLNEITAKLYKEGGSGIREYRFKHKKTKKYIWLEDKISFKINDKGKVIEQYGASRDITEQKEATLDLQKAHAKFKNLFDSSKDAVLILKNGNVIDCNLGAFEMFGKNKTKLIKTGLSDIILPNYKQESFHQKIKFAESGIPQKFEWIITSPNNDLVKVVEVIINRLFLEDGSHLQLIIRDISEQMEAKVLTETSEISFKNLFNNSSDMIFIIGEKGYFSDVNQEVIKTLEYSKLELSKMTTKDLSYPGQSMDYSSEAWKGIPQKFEWDARNKSGVKIPIEINLKKAQYFGKKVLIANARDISIRKKNEIALKASEEKFRRLFSTANDAIFIMDNETFVDCNEQTLKIFDCKRSEIIGHPPYEFSPENQPDGRSSLEKAIEKITNAANGTPQRFYWKHITKKGVPFDAEVSLNHFELDGKLFIQAMVRDISDKMEANRALIVSEEKFKTIADNAPVLIRMTDSANSSYFFSSQFINFIGEKESNLIGKKWEKIIHKDEADLVKDTHNQAFRSKIKFEISYRVKNSKNKYRWILETGIPHFSEDKKFQGFITASIDITGRKVVEEALKNEETLRKSNELFRDTLESISLVAVTLNTKGIITFCNNHFAKTVGSTKKDLINKNWFDLFVDKKVRNNRKEKFKERVLKESMPTNFTSSITSLNNKNLTLSWHNIFLRNDKNDIVGITSIGEDVTKSKQDSLIKEVYNNINNYSLQTNTLKEFYKNVHHEISKLFTINNFYISIHNKENDKVTFPYFIDEKHPQKDEIDQRDYKNSLSEFVINSNQNQNLKKEDFIKIYKKNKIKIKGEFAQQWVGIPLKTKGDAFGILAIQDYKNPTFFSDEDIEILTFISNQIAIAIERKQNEELIQKNEAKFRSIFESLQDVYYKSTIEGEILVISPSIENIAGYQPEYLIGQSIQNLYANPNELNNFNELIKDNSIIKNYELELLKKDGTTIIALANVQQVFDENKKPIAIEGIIRDISNIKQAEEDLKLFENMIQDNWDAVVFADLTGSVKYINEAANKLYGYSNKELIGKNIDIFNSELTHNTDEIVESIQMNGGWVGELKQKKKNNEIFDALLSVQLIYNKKGEPIGMASHSKDITDRKHKERELLEAKNIAESSLKVKEQFLANMSHELRTPMNGIIGITELLKDTPLHTEQNEFVNIIQKSSNNLLYILNDILDLSKIEAGKIEISPIPTNLKETLEKVSSLFEYQIRSKDLKLIYEIDGNIPSIIKIDETRLIQILSNFISNAIKFTNEGTITIKVRQFKKGLNGKFHLLFEIIDTGIGIQKEEFSKLFNYFSQIDNTLSKEYKGTGLGLAISKELSILMGGEVGIKSKHNIGSTFWFTIETSKDELIATEPVKQTKDVDISRLNILVVDDNAVNLKVSEKLIEKLGGKAQLCDSGRAALELLNKNNYDIIFMDIQMPDMNGIETLEKIKQFNTTTPIIAMTAYAMKTDKEKFINLGFDDYLAKPISSSMISGIITKWSKHIPQEKLIKTSSLLKNESLSKLIELGGEEFLTEILLEYKKESSNLILSLKNNLDKNDYQETSNIFHTLKGSSSTLGLFSISELCKNGEEKCLKKNNKKIKAIIAEIDNLFNKFIVDYNID